jgi:hypothetical protein
MTELEQLDVLVGSWTTEVTHPLVDGVVPGSASFEWLSGRRFLIWRTQVEHDDFPDGMAVIGPRENADGLAMEYFDSRGVRRTYAVAVEDASWHCLRDEPGFEQRFSATLAADSFELLTELARTPGEWKQDLTATYRRRC